MDENLQIKENNNQQENVQIIDQDKQRVKESYDREIARHRTATEALNAAGKRRNAQGQHRDAAG